MRKEFSSFNDVCKTSIKISEVISINKQRGTIDGLNNEIRIKYKNGSSEVLLYEDNEEGDRLENADYLNFISPNLNDL